MPANSHLRNPPKRVKELPNEREARILGAVMVPNYLQKLNSNTIRFLAIPLALKLDLMPERGVGPRWLGGDIEKNSAEEGEEPESAGMMEVSLP